MAFVSPLKYRHRVLAMLCLLSVITYIDRVCISVAGKAMQDDLQIRPEQWGWVTGLFAIAYAAFEIPSGVLGDRIGPRRVLTRIVVWWSAFTTLTGTVKSFVQLLVVQFFFGAGEAGAFPNSTATISRWFPKVERGRAQGTVWMASRAGGAISPILVIPIQARFGWRASFLFVGSLGIVWAVAWYLWFRDTPREKAAVTEEELREIELGSAVVDATVKHGLPWAIVTRKRNFWALLLMYHTYCWGSFFFLSWLHTFLARGRGFSPTEIATLAPLPFIFGGCANLCGGFATDAMVRKLGLKWGRRGVAMIGLSASSLFMLLTSMTQDKIASVVLVGLAYAGSDFMLPVAWATCLDIGKRYVGAVSGAMNTAGQIGSFLSSVVFGYLIVYFHSYNAPLIVMFVFLAISAALWMLIDPTQELIPEETVS